MLINLDDKIKIHVEIPAGSKYDHSNKFFTE